LLSLYQVWNVSDNHGYRCNGWILLEECRLSPETGLVNRTDIEDRVLVLSTYDLELGKEEERETISNQAEERDGYIQYEKWN